MSRLASSDHALRALVLLAQQPRDIRVARVAELLGVSYTGAEVALEILAGDGLIDTHPRPSLRVSPRSAAVVRSALALLPGEAALSAIALGNPAVEFAGADDDGALVVLRRFSQPADEARARSTIDDLAALQPGLSVEIARKEDLRERLLVDLGPRQRAQAMRVLAGSVERTFPDRTRHGGVDGRPLGRLNVALRAPSARRMRELARTYGLARIVVFGSATRTDLRPDSDVDLLIEPKTGARLDVVGRARLMADMERLFDRDVDLVTAPVRDRRLADEIARDGVVLHDATR